MSGIVGLDEGDNFVQGAATVDFFPEARSAGKSFDIPAGDVARLEMRDFFPVKSRVEAQVLPDCAPDFDQGRTVNFFVPECRPDIFVNPRISERAAADRDPVTTGVFFDPARVAGRKNIAIAENRDCDCSLDHFDHVPIGFSGISLGPGPSVNGDGGKPAGLGELGEVKGLLPAGIGKTSSHFDRDGHFAYGARDG